MKTFKTFGLKFHHICCTKERFLKVIKNDLYLRTELQVNVQLELIIAFAQNSFFIMIIFIHFSN